MTSTDYFDRFRQDRFEGKRIVERLLSPAADQKAFMEALEKDIGDEEAKEKEKLKASDKVQYEFGDSTDESVIVVTPTSSNSAGEENTEEKAEGETSSILTNPKVNEGGQVSDEAMTSPAPASPQTQQEEMASPVLPDPKAKEGGAATAKTLFESQSLTIEEKKAAGESTPVLADPKVKEGDKATGKIQFEAHLPPLTHML